MEKFLTISQLGGKKPHFTKNGNIKLGKTMWVWSTMKGGYDEARFIKPFNGYCSGTCGNNCECCTKSCYVNRSYRYGSVLKGHTINTVWMKENMKGTFDILSKQLKRAHNKPEQIRINQSGEIMNTQELINWVILSSSYPDIDFYVYTKNYKAVKELYDLNDMIRIPNNFTILLSIWHEVGIDYWNQLKQYNNIKAFVYDDGQLNLIPQTYCKAYDEKGHMNHDITCDKCKKCFNRSDKTKIIGCKAH